MRCGVGLAEGGKVVGRAADAGESVVGGFRRWLVRRAGVGRRGLSRLGFGVVLRGAFVVGVVGVVGVDADGVGLGVGWDYDYD